MTWSGLSLIYAVAQEEEWAPGQVWTSAENLAPSGKRSPTVQTAASRYTVCAIPALHIDVKSSKLWISVFRNSTMQSGAYK